MQILKIHWDFLEILIYRASKISKVATRHVRHLFLSI